MANPFTRQQVQRAEYDYACHSITVHPDFDHENALRPEMWSLIAQAEGMRVGDEVRIVPADAAWILRLIVTFRKGTACHVAQESFSRLKAQKSDKKTAEAMGDRYKADFRGPHARWCVIDQETGEKLFEQLQDKEDAEAEIRKLMAPA